MRVAGGGGAEKEGEREGEGEGRQGIAGARSLSAPSPLPSSCSPGSSGGSRTWPSAAGGGRPPSGRGGPLQGPTTDRPSSTACSSPRSRSTIRTHSLQTPSRGRLPEGERGCRCPQSRLPQAHPGPPTLSLLLLEKVPHCLQTRRLRPLAQTGTEATAPPCVRPPSRSGARSRERPVRGGGVQRAPGSGLGSRAADASRSPFLGRAPSHLVEDSLASAE